ncbi:MAG: HupE/UreJ family protein [Prolixibacteraceae bacterium]
MNEFLFYLKQGINHITDLNGLDHMVFIITLCAVFTLSQWKRILILVSAFTVGHTITLALSGLNIIAINQQLVETIIPVTILLTSIYNIVKGPANNQRIQMNYFLALFFGLVHGMGFSNFFRAMMMGVSDHSIAFPLFSFNLGVEVGQIFIVSLFLLVNFILTSTFRMKHHDWNLVVSGAGGGIAATLIISSILS